MGILRWTTRKAEVLSLVARGFTDREIAEALVISIKTPSVHAYHILGKLGGTNPGEAAAVGHALPSARDCTPATSPDERLAEHCDVGVVVAERSSVERLLRRPHEGRDRAGR